MERWSGRVALVTGASEGIGRATAVKLAGHGMKVVVCARNKEKLQEATDEVKKSGVKGELFPFRCDLRNEEEILTMFKMIKEKYGGVDVCINNAGIGGHTSLIDVSTDIWRDMLNVNVLGLSICTREAIKSMRERNVDDGHIIHLSRCSGNSRLMPMAGHRNVPGVGFYCATKHAVRSLTEGLRQELRELKSHIRVSSISPGRVSTEMVRRLYEPNIREMDTSDIADTVAFILSAPAHVQIHDILVRPTEQIP